MFREKLCCVWACLLMLSITAWAQEKQSAEPEPQKVTDSLQIVSDSIIDELRHQVQELKLQSILMKEQLDLSEKGAHEESMRLAARKASIDSLRQVTQGAPLVVEDDTLLLIYARNGGMLPEARAKEASEKIFEAGKSLAVFLDSIYIYDSEGQTDVMIGDEVLLSVTDMDALWNNAERLELAEQYKTIISDKVKELHDIYGFQQKLKGIFMVLIIIAIQAFFIWLTLRLFRRWKCQLTRKLLTILKPLQFKDYVLLDQHRLGIALIVCFDLLKLFCIFLQLLVSIPLLFSVFPETKRLTYTLFGYIWNPISKILSMIIGYIPNLFQIIIIVLCFRYLIKAIKYFANEIATGKLKISGFYPDWAMPTFVILRILCYSFMFVMIWPLLPSSNSEVFQGVSVFIGIIVSLGSTSIVGNVMAGLVMTYMRPFRLGDFVRFGEIEGEVVERSILVTRIRTLKNELVTIPNSNLMGSQISNYTFSAQKYGIIVHTKITIGYDEPWKKIESLLLKAAEKTDGIKARPKPFVRLTSLDDSYVEYEINAYTDKHKSLPTVYSALRSNILDTLHRGGVEIMSPTIFAHRPDLPLQIPEEDQKMSKMGGSLE